MAAVAPAGGLAWVGLASTSALRARVIDDSPAAGIRPHFAQHTTLDLPTATAALADAVHARQVSPEHARPALDVRSIQNADPAALTSEFQFPGAMIHESPPFSPANAPSWNIACHRGHPCQRRRSGRVSRIGGIRGRQDSLCKRYFHAQWSFAMTQTQVTVQNDNDDDARNVQLVFTLPPTSHVLTAPANAVIPVSYADPSTSWRTVGQVTVGLDTIAVGQTVTISLTTEMLASQVTPATSIGVFVFGSVPDPNAANNSRSLAIHG